MCSCFDTNFLRGDDDLKQTGFTRYLALIKYPFVLAGVLVTSLVVAATVYLSEMRTVTIYYDGQLLEVVTSCNTVAEVLRQAEIELETSDYINCELTDCVTEVGTIEILRPVTFTVELEGEEMVLTTFSQTVSEALRENGIELTAQDFLTGATLDAQVKDGLSFQVVRVDSSYELKEESVPFTVEQIPTDKMYKGESKVIREGVPGKRVLTYQLCWEDGVLVSRELYSDEIEVAPVTQQVLYGTRDVFQNSRGEDITFSKVLSVKATAYTACEVWGHSTASGMYAQIGVIAVDPKVIPMGTKVYIAGVGKVPDYGYAIAGDTGGLIKGNKIDLYLNDEASCDKWGIKDVEVYILEDQSVDIFALRGTEEIERYR